jgi:hypothetical protein
MAAAVPPQADTDTPKNKKLKVSIFFPSFLFFSSSQKHAELGDQKVDRVSTLPFSAVRAFQIL